jgi:predicted SprT family Zn-dependent metalloprotease
VLRSDRQLSFSFLDHQGEGRTVPGFQRQSVYPKGEDREWIEFCKGHLVRLQLEELADRIVVEWNPRMRSSAGRALWPDGLIQLNPRLPEISESEVRRTVLHELAHLIAYERHPHRRIKGHGREWQRACTEVGIPGEGATHQLALPTRTLRRQWRYECPECDQGFERVRRFKSAVACFECCRNSNGGFYHERYRLVERRITG